MRTIDCGRVGAGCGLRIFTGGGCVLAPFLRSYAPGPSVSFLIRRLIVIYLPVPFRGRTPDLRRGEHESCC